MTTVLLLVKLLQNHVIPDSFYKLKMEFVATEGLTLDSLLIIS